MIFLVIVGIIAILLLIFAIIVIQNPPKVPLLDSTYDVKVNNDGIRFIGNHFLKKNQFGIWEMFISGKPYERGLINGKLTSELIYLQEKYFVNEIRKIINKPLYLTFLKLVVAYMNRKLPKFIDDEFNQEIYGISKSASKEFSMIGPGYTRIMNYHAAHDIGHTLEYMKFVGCTSFALWGDRTEDGKLIHARNFDFHAGDEFSKNKIVTFYAPDQGYKFMMITWGGMIGTVSGMNINGIAITVNAAKSKLPLKSSVPITILVREILQYALNLQEAINIATKRQIFVSESIHISSGNENRSIVIEKTPFQTNYFTPSEVLICTNHFQSDKLYNDPSNQKQIRESSSMKRHQRVAELIKKEKIWNISKAVELLRNRNGLGDTCIGNGNELAINQLIAHHGIVFKPNELKCWVSSAPYSCGEFVCYDLQKVFSTISTSDLSTTLSNNAENIPADEFLKEIEFENFIHFNQLRIKLKTVEHYEDGAPMAEEIITKNKESYLAYYEAGDFYYKFRDYSKAKEKYQIGLTKAIPTLIEEKHMHKGIEKCIRKS